MYPSGSKVIAGPTAAWADGVVEGILTHADQDGTLKAGAVDNAGVLASDVVTTAKILDDAVTAPKIVGVDKSNLTTDSNPYKFRAYRTAPHNFTTSFTKVPFETESYDTNSNFDVTTNVGRYTAPVAGFYQFNARCSTSQSSGTHRLVIALYKNGSELSRGSDVFAGYFNGSVVSDTIQLAANDYIEVYALGDTTLAADVTAPSTTNYFSGFLISRT